MKKLLAVLLFMAAASPVLAMENVQLEDMTWPEIRQRLRQGATTIIIPTGGTEQNGPHIALGKHNWIVRHTAQEVARELKNALVAPVIAYVPEGEVNGDGHMQFPGTITLRESTFAQLLEDAARSFRRHGFTLICFIGDSGGNQRAQREVADRLSREWKDAGVRVLHVSDYYDNEEGIAWARMQADGDPAAHGGFMDTAETLAVRPDAVRRAQIIAYDEKDFPKLGVSGNPTAATAQAGKRLLSFKVKEAVRQIRAAQSGR